MHIIYIYNMYIATCEFMCTQLCTNQSQFKLTVGIVHTVATPPPLPPPTHTSSVT